MSKKKVPELRFKGFTEDWEQRKWIETIDISTNMVDPKSGEFDNLPHIGPGNIESFTGRILDNVKSVKEDKLISGKFHFTSGDILYGKINPQLGKYALVNFEGLASADSYVLNTKNGINQNFMFRILQNSHFYKYSVSVSMRTGMPKINRHELNQFSYLAPSYKEQEQIGVFLKKIDDVIALHHRKLRKLELLRQGFTQYILPKRGNKSPQFRFTHFHLDWKQCKLGDFLKIPKKEKIKVTEVSQLMTVKLNLEGVYSGSNRETLSFGSTTYYKRHSGQFIYGKQNFFNGSMAIIPEDLEGKATSGDVPTLDIINIDVNYFFSYISRPIYWKSKEAYSSGTGSKRIHEQTLQSFEISVPSLEEQVKIGSLLKELDNKILLYKEKTKVLDNLKKAFLQKMFI